MTGAQEITLYFFLTATLIQLLYQFIVFSRVWFYKEPNDKQERPVSVIVSSKNHVDLLKQNLPKYLAQEYPCFEVVVINDASWDGTDDFLEELEKVHSNLKVVNNSFQENERFSKGKKFALTLAIKAASYDTLLFSDADSFPSSVNWLSKMQDGFSSKKQIILACSRYEKRKGLLNKILRYESLYEGLLSVSCTMLGFPVLANKRNLAYERSLFFSVNGFLSHLNLSRGEAELFVNEVSTLRNSSVCLGDDAMTICAEQPSMLDWIRDKRAYFNIAKQFRFSSLFLLGLNFFSQLAYWLLFFILLISQVELQVVLMFFSLRLCVQYIVYWKMCKYSNEQSLLWLLPFYEIALMFIHLMIYLSTHIKRVHNWD